MASFVTQQLIKFLFSKLNNINNFILHYFYPPKCFSCGTDIFGVHGLCHSCFKKFNFIDTFCCIKCGRKSIYENFECGMCVSGNHAFDLARSLMIFDTFSKGVIYQMKYQDHYGMANIFARMLFDRYKTIIDEFDVIVPVPMYFFKRILRQYNPADNLARELSNLSNKQFFPNALKKINFTKSQIGLSREERKRNLAGSIKITKKHCVHNKNVILIDDVMTTSSTANLCSKVLLKQGGAKKVCVLTVASV